MPSNVSSPAPPNPLPFWLIGNAASFLYSPVFEYYPRIMTLFQEVVASKEMLTAYTRRLHCSPWQQIMLDNGAHEGIDVDVDRYIEFVVATPPDVVVLPDLVGRPSTESFKLTIDSFKKMYTRLASCASGRHRLPAMTFMFVGQGSSRDDVIECYDRLVEWMARHDEEVPCRLILGVGQAYLHWATNDDEKHYETTRTFLIERLRDRGLLQFPVHILGARWRPSRLYGHLTDVEWFGIDSVKPVKCAIVDTTYPERPLYTMPLSDMTHPSPVALVRNISTFCHEYGASCAGLRPADWYALASSCPANPFDD